MSVSVSQFKARLSEFLRTVEAGEEVMITDRGRPVARLGPVAGQTNWDQRIVQLVARGLAKPPVRTEPLPPSFWDEPLPQDETGLALKYLLEERRDGR